MVAYSIDLWNDVEPQIDRTAPLPRQHNMDLETFILANEPFIRLGFFVGVFAVVAAWEVVAPRRALTVAKGLRWTANLGLVVLNTVLLRLALPLAAVGMAAFASAHGWGLLNHFAVPMWLAVPAAVIAMDFVIWLQHVMVHAVPALWRLHRVHHADLDYDLTTGARFHPIEIFLSMGIKFATIVVLGPPVVAVMVFEVLLNATAMFNHGNIRLPAALDRVLRWLVVPPDMHRVHHSVAEDETNSNFGFNLPWWDRLFGTYRARPRAGHEAMTIGIHGHRDPREVARLPGMLMLPFRGEDEGYAINRRLWTEAGDAEPGHRDERRLA
jgi:sterol desaturase/sphingolipid hydroxylase (fatty acid hydroxylase superfamily)